MEKQTHVYNLCESRGEPRCRVWLERERVAAAGFKRGKTFRKVWDEKKETLTLEVIASAEGLKRAEFGTVCGTTERPIIDICGAQVKKVLGKSAQYEATFSAGRIVIRRAS